MIPIRGSVRSLHAPVVTLLLVAANVLAFVWEVGLAEPALEHAVLTLGVVPAREVATLREAPLLLDHWLLPLFTSMFLHGGWAHLVGNMLFLWVFGDGVEARLGPLRFLAFYFVAGIAASQAQVWIDPTSTIPMIGASGAIAGVLGAYFILFPRAWVLVMLPVFVFPLFFRVPALLFLGLWFLEQLAVGTMFALSPTSQVAGGVAWWAHAGGFAAGFVFAPLAARQVPRRRVGNELRSLEPSGPRRIAGR